MASKPGEDTIIDETNEAPAIAPEDPHVAVANEGIRQGIGTEAVDTLNKLTVGASFEDMAARIPEIRAMIGMDQRSDYHSLTLDEHTKEFVRNLLEDSFISSHPKRAIIALAGYLHDTGKTSSDGQQISPKDPEKRQYVGHEKESERMAAEIIDRDFVGIDEEDKALIRGLAALHAAALTLVQNFTRDNQPKGKTLGAYDDFIAKVEAIPVNLSPDDKMKIVFAFNRADKLAGWNSESPVDDPKVQGIKRKVEVQLNGLQELQKALPSLIEAVNKRRLGQKELDEEVPKERREGDTGAGIRYDKDTGIYSLATAQSAEAPTAMDGKQIGLIMQNLDNIGVSKENKGAFGKALREGGIPALEGAGFGEYTGAVKQLLSQ